MVLFLNLNHSTNAKYFQKFLIIGKLKKPNQN